MKQISLMIPESKWYSYLAVVDDDVVERLKYVDEDELYLLLEPHIDWESAVEEDWVHDGIPTLAILHIEDCKP
jgi:hypothetical protein